MSDTLLAHRFRRIESLSHHEEFSLDRARDIASESDGFLLSLPARGALALEGALRLRLADFADCALMRDFSPQIVLTNEHGLYLFLATSDAVPWTQSFPTLSEAERIDELGRLQAGLVELRDRGVPAGALTLSQLYRDADGPFFLPSAYAVPPAALAERSPMVRHVDRAGAQHELNAFVDEVTQWLEQAKFLPPAVSPLKEFATSSPDLAWLNELSDLADRGGSVVASGAGTLPAEHREALRQWSLDRGRVVFTLCPHLRPARIPRKDGVQKGAVVVLEQFAVYPAFAEALASLRAAGWIDGTETLLILAAPEMDEASRLFLASLRQRGSDRFAEVEVPRASSPTSTEALDDVERRLVETLHVAGRPLGEALLEKAYSLSPASFVSVARRLAQRGAVELLYGRVAEGPSGAQLVLGLASKPTTSPSVARVEEISSLLGSALESIPGRGLGRGWLLLESTLRTQRTRALPLARKLVRQARRADRDLFEFAVHAETRREEFARLPLRLDDRCRAAISMGGQYFERGELDRADATLSEAMRHLDAATSAEGARVAPLAVELILLAGRLAVQREGAHEAEKILREAIDRFREDLPATERARLYLEHCAQLLAVGRLRDAAERAELTLRMFDAERSPEQTARAYLLYGIALYGESSYSQSILSLQRALVLWEQRGDLDNAARVYNNLALNYRSMGRLKDAERCLRQSLELKERVGDSRLLLSGRLNLGYLALDLQDFEDARACGEECLQLAQSMGQRVMEAEAYGLLGEALLGMGEHDRAREYLNKDLEISIELDLDNERLATLRRLVALLLQVDDLDEAANLLEEAREVSGVVPSRYEAAMLDLLEAQLLERTHALQPSVDAYQAAGRGFARLNRFDLELEAIAGRGSVELRLGRTAAAAEALREARDRIARHEIHRTPDTFRELQEQLGDQEGAREIEFEGAHRCLASLARLMIPGGAAHGPAEILASVSDALLTEEVLLIRRHGESVGRVRGVFGPVAVPADLQAYLDEANPVHPVHTFEDWSAVSIVEEPGAWLAFTRNRSAQEDELAFLRVVAGLLTMRATPVRRHSALEPSALEAESEHGLIGNSPALLDVLRMVDVVKDNDVTILLLGENGTGKDLVARAIFQAGRRHEGPFVALNCASIPPTLLESELFGHERGAFTSAHEQRIGAFERAHTGTIFLDEIGELDLAMQAKLLRVLQDNTFTRVGGSKTIQADVRVIAATNRDLAAEVERGAFRTDLYYRLNVISIQIPPLRERIEDLGLLANHFLVKFADDFSSPIRGITQEAVARLMEYEWPGNVRELENVIKNAMVFAEGDVVRIEDLPATILQTQPGRQRQSVEEAVRAMVAAEDFSEERPLMPRLELLMAHEAVRSMGNKSRAARLLGITKPTLYNRLKRFDALYGTGDSDEVG